MKDRLVHWLMRFSIFLLSSAGWVAIGVVTGFIVSFFFRPTGRVDTFALTETMLGVVITGLSIVGAFIIALQWSNLDKRMHEFDIKVKETNELFDKTDKRAKKLVKDTDDFVKSKLDYIDDYVKSYVDYFEGLLKENAKVANETNTIIEDYKKTYVENEKRFSERQKAFDDREKRFEQREEESDERQKELSKIIADSKELIEKTIRLQKKEMKQEI